MNKQREAINKSLKGGNFVEVYALEIPNRKTKVNGMEIDNYLAQDYEKALIEKFRPSWNGRK